MTRYRFEAMKYNFKKRKELRRNAKYKITKFGNWRKCIKQKFQSLAGGSVDILLTNYKLVVGLAG